MKKSTKAVAPGYTDLYDGFIDVLAAFYCAEEGVNDEYYDVGKERETW